MAYINLYAIKYLISILDFLLYNIAMILSKIYNN